MDAKEVIQLLRLQRHDLMNELQIVHGYLSMGKTEKVNAKVEEIIAAFSRERLLMNSNCPNFALWLMQVNWLHNNIRFTYDIHTTNRNLAAYDMTLTTYGNALIESIADVVQNDLEVVEGNIQLVVKEATIELITSLPGRTIDYEALKKIIQNNIDHVNGAIDVNESDSEIICTFSIPA
ncbi:Spo0B domain-containing protein [Ornithinibacillus contaminans]|uniref:Spo0B domain-containing protein n=1 Tax=Ornithinibacillus contaminans TaxID=694055 RepID=UPI00069F8959|nr:Spo0B domain-containing protein [Ornithinibacillus contaminans]